MIKGKVYVIQRIAYLVSDGRAEAPDDGRFFRLLKLSFEIRLFLEFARHLVESCCELSHLVSPVLAGHTNAQVAVGHTPRRVRKVGDRPRKSPNQKKSDQC